MLCFNNSGSRIKKTTVESYDLPGEAQYLSVLRYIIEDEGSYDPFTGYITTFSPPMLSFSLYGSNLPILTTRKMDIRRCVELTINVLDVIKEVIDSEFTNSIETISTWDYEAITDTKSTTQFFIDDGDISSHVYIYHVDAILGLPYDIVHHALILHFIAHLTGRKAKRLTMSIGGCYFNTKYMAPVLEQLKKEPKKQPKIHIISENRNTIELEHIHIENYYPHSEIIIGNHHEPTAAATGTTTSGGGGGA